MYLTTTYYICKQGISEIHEIQIEFQSLLVSEFRTTRLDTSNIVYVMQRSRYEPEMTTRTYSCSLTFFCVVSARRSFLQVQQSLRWYIAIMPRGIFWGPPRDRSQNDVTSFVFMIPYAFSTLVILGFIWGLNIFLSCFCMLLLCRTNYIETLGNPQNCITISYSPFLKQIKLLILTQDKRTTELPRSPHKY